MRRRAKKFLLLGREVSGQCTVSWDCPRRKHSYQRSFCSGALWGKLNKVEDGMDHNC